jgi:hypothetical protein
LQAINIPSKIAKYMTEGGGKQWINGETITGMALVLMSLLFIWAGTMNSVWASIQIAAYVILAIGAGFIVLGVVTIRRTNHPSEKHGYY